MDAVSWSVTPATSRPLRRLVYSVLGLFGGLGALVGAILVALAVDLWSAGDPRLLVLLVAIGGIGGGVVALYVRPALRAGDRERTRGEALLAGLEPRWLAIASLAGAAALWFLSRTAVVAALSVVALATIALVALLGTIPAEGRIDPEANTLTVGTREVQLDGVAGATGYAIGPATVLRLSYGPSASGPRLVLVPTNTGGVIRETVGGDGPADVESEHARSGNRSGRRGGSRP